MYNVLIADDEIIERKYLRKIFLKYPEIYKVISEAGSGEDVLKQVKENCPDIIIMDINMPLGNGLDTAIHIKELYPDVIILLNTAYEEFEFARKAIEFHMDGYLLKPTSESEIFHIITHCLRKNITATNKIDYFIPNDDSVFIDEIVRHIEKNFKEPIDLQTLSKLVHFSPSYLSRVFHKEKGITLRTFINQVRINHAIKLLKETKLSVYEIARLCGFINTSHFNRVFKQQIGKSPTEIRKGN